jgi:hypothetical protein
MKEIIFSRKGAKLAKKNLCGLGVLARALLKFDSFVKMLASQGLLGLPRLSAFCFIHTIGAVSS